MRKITKHIFSRMDQDMAKDKRTSELYWEARNLKLTNNGNNLSLSTHDGIDHLLELGRASVTNKFNYSYRLNGTQFVEETIENPTLEGYGYMYEDVNIVGVVEGLDDLIIVAVYGTDRESSTTAFFRLRYDDGNYSLKIIFYHYLQMDINKPIDLVYNFENSLVEKIYWADGYNQLRSLNMNDGGLLTKSANILNIVGENSLTAPTEINLDRTASGLFPKSVVQYAYILYNNSGGLSQLSPLSSPFYITDKEDNGESYHEWENDTVDGVVEFRINDIPNNFDNIKVFRLQYTLDSEVQANSPHVYEILDKEIDALNINVTDKQDPELEEISFSELLGMTPNIVVPKHIESVKDRLIVANYSIINLDVSKYDSRAFSYMYTNNSSDVRYQTIVNSSNGETFTISASGVGEEDFPPMDFDCIKPDNKKYIMYPGRYDGDTINLDYLQNSPFGAKGRNIDVHLSFVPVEGANAYFNDPELKDYVLKYNQGFKQRETYRIGIEYFDKFGTKSPVYWITDMYIPTFKYSYSSQYKNIPVIPVIKVNLRNTNVLEDLGIKQYRIMFVKRSKIDMSVVSQGFMTPVLKQTFNNGIIRHWTSPFTYDLYSASENRGANIFRDTSMPAVPPEFSGWGVEDDSNVRLSNIMSIYTPDALFNNLIDFSNVKVARVGTAVIRHESMDGTAGHMLGCGTRVNETSDVDCSSFTQPGSSVTTYGNAEFARPSSTDVKNTDWRKSYLKMHSFDNAHEEPLLYELSSDGILVTDINSPNSYRIGDAYIIDHHHTDSGLLGATECNYRTASSYLLQLPNNYGSNGEAFRWSDFYNATDLRYKRSLPIVELTREIANQYGGNTYEARSKNEYVVSSDVKDITEEAVGVGDIYLQNFKVLKTTQWDTGINIEKIVYTEWIATYVESNVNIYAREDKILDFFKGLNATSGDDGYCYGYQSTWRHGDFNHLRNIFKSQPSMSDLAVPFNYNMISNFRLEVVGSKKKSINESLDSWLDFNTADTLTLNSDYGEITALTKLNGELIAFQDRAVCNVLVDPSAQQAQSVGNTDIDLVLGEAAGLYSHRYIDSNSGTVHKFSVVETKTAIYYYDFYNNAVSILANSELNELTTVLGLYSKFDDFKRINGIYNGSDKLLSNVYASFNNKNELIYFTFIAANGERMTLTYSPATKGFISFYDFNDNGFGLYKGQFYTIDKNRLNIFNDQSVSYYEGQESNSLIQPSVTILNSIPDNVIKRYDNIEFTPIRREDYFAQSFNTWRIWNSYQDTGLVPFKPSLRLRKNRAVIPREAGTLNRIRDDHAFLQFNYDGGHKIQIDGIYVMYDIAQTNSYKFIK